MASLVCQEQQIGNFIIQLAINNTTLAPTYHVGCYELREGLPYLVKEKTYAYSEERKAKAAYKRYCKEVTK